MDTSVQVTLIICATLIILAIIRVWSSSRLPTLKIDGYRHNLNVASKDVSTAKKY